VAHLRLRKFNTRDAYPDQNLDNDLCMVVRANNTVYVRGQTAMDLDRSYREPVYRVVGKWLKGVYPVSTGLIVQGLSRPEYLMEIDVIAEVPAARA
jgi:enamine deaminase RidA (YjgF/YER057c/UK114 family)